MQKWEYAELEATIGLTGNKAEVFYFRADGKHEIKKSDRMSSLLVQLGEEGWELVTARASDKNKVSYMFKRPKA